MNEEHMTKEIEKLWRETHLLRKEIEALKDLLTKQNQPQQPSSGLLFW